MLLQMPFAGQLAKRDDNHPIFYVHYYPTRLHQMIPVQSQLQCERLSFHSVDFAPKCVEQESLLAIHPRGVGDREQLSLVGHSIPYAPLWTSGG